MPLFSIVYAIPYLIVLFIVSYAWGVEQKSSLNASIIILIVLIIFLGLRGHLFTDYISYYPFFNQLPTLGDLTDRRIDQISFEPGFVIYASLIKTLYPDYFFFTFVSTLIDLVVLYFVFRRYSFSIALSFMFFLAFQGLIIEVNLMRNVKAMMLFLLSIPYLQKRRIVPYMALNLLGFAFHQSALIYIIAYFVLDRQLSKKLIGIIFIGANVVFFLKLSLTGPIVEWIVANVEISRAGRLNAYLNSAEELGISIGYLERTLIYMLVWRYYDCLIKAKDCNRIFCNSLIAYYLVFYLFYDVEVFVSRLTFMFVFSYWFLGANIYGYLVEVKRFHKGVLCLCIIVLCFMKVSISNRSIIADYNNVLTGVQDYYQRRAIYFSHKELH